MDQYFLKTDRIGFRCWQNDDADLAWQLWGDPEVTNMIDARTPLSREQVTEKLQQEILNFRVSGVQYFPVCLYQSHHFVGCCGLRPYDPDQQVYEIGFHLLKKYWGQGLAREASTVMIRYAFDTVKVKKLFAGHHPRNTGSARLLQSLGFEFIENQYYAPTGLLHPSYLLTPQKEG